MFEQVIRFFQESYQELKLASWLSREQMMASTAIVLSLTIIVAIYVSCIDRVLLWVAGILFRIG